MQGTGWAWDKQGGGAGCGGRATLCHIVRCHPGREAQPCPRGWWGHPTCGPCSCDVTKGFDPDCNKTTGECRCKVSPRP